MTQEVELDDLAGVFADIGRQFEKIDYQPALADFILQLEEDHKRRFGLAVSPSGEPWKPLSEATVAKKKHDTILVETTELYRHLTSGEGIREVTPGEMIFGTDRAGAGAHQEGAPSRNLPARPHTGIPEELLASFVDQLADHTVEELTE